MLQEPIFPTRVRERHEAQATEKAEEREMIAWICKSQDLRRLRSEELKLEASLSYRVRLS